MEFHSYPALQYCALGGPQSVGLGVQEFNSLMGAVNESALYHSNDTYGNNPNGICIIQHTVPILKADSFYISHEYREYHCHEYHGNNPNDI